MKIGKGMGFGNIFWFIDDFTTLNDCGDIVGNIPQNLSPWIQTKERNSWLSGRITAIP